ncbi:hypothetical protein BJX99DRAFT_240192 [Aspergillus californicus]
MPQSLVLCTPFFPLDSVQLGRLVLSIDEPQQDYFDPPINSEEDVLVQRHEQYEGIHSTDHNRDFASLLTRLVTAAHIKRTRTSTQVSTDQATTYQLQNSGAWFQRALGAETTREWIERAIDQGDDVYLIVGYHTFQDARFRERAVDIRKTLAQLDLPITAAVSGITGAGLGIETLIHGGGLADAAVSGSRQLDDSLKKQYVATGEQVVAIQYRKLRFKWYSSRNIERASLDGNRWYTTWGMRGEQDESVDDILEADLQDELAIDQDPQSQQKSKVFQVNEWDIYL